MSSMDKLASELNKAIKEEDSRKPKAYDTPAEVLRVEGETAWVHIPGGIDETPIKRTINAKPGDVVQVRVSDGNAWITGNASNPPTDDTTANRAAGIAINASEIAEIAVSNANRARDAADAAVVSAEEASTNAGIAKTAADTSLSNLSQVQSVLDVVNWVAQHGTYVKAETYVEGTTYYTLVAAQVTNPSEKDKDSDGVLIYYEKDSNDVYFRTTDKQIVTSKTYYTVVGTPVSTPKSEDLNKYYKLNIGDAMGDYINKHLVLTNDGLVVMADDSEWKVLVANDGVYIINPEGDNVAKYKDTITVGKDDGTEGVQVIDYRSIKMYDRANTPVSDTSVPYFWVSDLKTKEDQIISVTDEVRITGDYQHQQYLYFFYLASETSLPFSPVDGSIFSITYEYNGDRITVDQSGDFYNRFYVSSRRIGTISRHEMIDIYFYPERPAIKNDVYTIRYDIIEENTDESLTVIEEKEVEIIPSMNVTRIRVKELLDISTSRRHIIFRSISHNGTLMFGIYNGSSSSSLQPLTIKYKSVDGEQNYSSGTMTIEFTSPLLKAFTFGTRRSGSPLGSLSSSFGLDNTVSGDFSMALGKKLSVSGSRCLLIGDTSITSDDNLIKVVNHDPELDKPSLVLENSVTDDSLAIYLSEDGVYFAASNDEFADYNRGRGEILVVYDQRKIRTPNLRFEIDDSSRFVEKIFDGKPVYGTLKNVEITDSEHTPRIYDTGLQIFTGIDHDTNRYLHIHYSDFYEDVLSSNPYLLLKNGDLAVSGSLDAKTYTYDYSKFRYQSGFTNYATSGANAPKAVKFGKVVTLGGAIKSTAAQSSTGQKVMGYVPTNCKPAQDVMFLQQGSGVARYQLYIRASDGALIADRYGTTSDTPIPNGAWMNISATYISANALE